MIVSKEVEVSVGSHHLKYYLDLGYSAVCRKKLIVKVNDLPKMSTAIVCVKCDVCQKKFLKEYQNYNMSLYNGDYYACSSKCSKNKKETTSLKNNGVKNPMQNDKIKANSIQTRKNIYGSEDYTNKNKMKQTMLNLYGSQYAMQNEFIKNKSKNTCLERYGVEHVTQNENIFNKASMSGKKLKIHESTGLKYRGTYEKHFLDYCFENNIKVENYKSIRYDFKEKIKVYHPDFYLRDKNLIIEIKSTYTYNKYLEKNLAKQKSCLDQGYNFIFIIDKKYTEFNK